MTALDHPAQPSCPICGTNDQVQRDRLGTRHVLTCGRCWTVFQGGDDEWRSRAKAREAYRKRQEDECSTRSST